MTSKIVTKKAFYNNIKILSELINEGKPTGLETYHVNGPNTDSGFGEVNICLEDVSDLDAYISVSLSKEEAIFFAKAILSHCEILK